MNNLIALTESDLVSARGGAAGERDSLARDLGQYVGGVFGAYVGNPFLSFMPVVGPMYASWRGLVAASH